MAAVEAFKLALVRVLIGVVDATSVETTASTSVALLALLVVVHVATAVAVGHSIVVDDFRVDVTFLGVFVSGVYFVFSLLFGLAFRVASAVGTALTRATPLDLVAYTVLLAGLFGFALFPDKTWPVYVGGVRGLNAVVRPVALPVTTAIVAVAESVHPLHSLYNIRLQSTLVYPAFIDVAQCTGISLYDTALAVSRTTGNYTLVLSTSTLGVDVPDFTNASRQLVTTLGRARGFASCTCASGGALLEPTLTALADDDGLTTTLTAVTGTPFAFIADGRELFVNVNFTLARTFDGVLAVIAGGLATGDDIVRRNWDGVARTTIDRADGVPWVDFVGGPPVAFDLARGRFSRRFLWGKYIVNVVGNLGEVFTTYDGRERFAFDELVENSVVYETGIAQLTRWTGRALRHLADDIEGACSTSAECNAECRPRQGFGRCGGVLGPTAFFCRDDSECALGACDYSFGTCSDGTACTASPTCAGRGLCVEGACALNTSQSSGTFENFACERDADCDVCVRPEARCTGTCTGFSSKAGTCAIYIGAGVIEVAGTGQLAVSRVIQRTRAAVIELAIATVYTLVGRTVEGITTLFRFTVPPCPNSGRTYCTVPRNGAVVLDAAMFFTGHRDETSVCPAAVCNLPQCTSDIECRQQGNANFSTTFVGQAPWCNLDLGRCVYSPLTCAADAGAAVVGGDCIVTRPATSNRRCALRTCSSIGSCVNGSVTTYARDFDCNCVCPRDRVRELALEVSTGVIGVSDALGHVFGEKSALRCWTATTGHGVAMTADGIVDLVSQVPAIFSTCPPGELLGRCAGDFIPSTTRFCRNSGNCSTDERCDFTQGTCSNGLTCAVDSQCGGVGLCLSNVCSFETGVGASLATPGLLNPVANCTTHADCDRCFRPSPTCRELDLDAREILRSARSAGACFARGVTELVLPNASDAPVNSSLYFLEEAVRKAFDVPAQAGAEQAYASSVFFNELLSWVGAGTKPFLRPFAVTTLTSIIRGGAGPQYTLAATYLLFANGNVTDPNYARGVVLLGITNQMVADAPQIAEDIVRIIEDLSTCFFGVVEATVNLVRNFVAFVGNKNEPVTDPLAPVQACLERIGVFIIDVVCVTSPEICCVLQDISCFANRPIEPYICPNTTATSCAQTGEFICVVEGIICSIANCTVPVCTVPPPMMTSLASVETTTLMPLVCEAFERPCAFDDVAFEARAAMDDALVPVVEFLRNETCTRTNSTSGACAPPLDATSLHAGAPAALPADLAPPAACCWRNTSAPPSATNVRRSPCAAAAYLRLDFVDVLHDRTCVVVEKRGCFAHVVDDASLIDVVGAGECCNAANASGVGPCPGDPSLAFDAWARYADARASAARIRAATVAAFGGDEYTPTPAVVVPRPTVAVVVAALNALRGRAAVVRACLTTLAPVLDAQAATYWPPVIDDADASLSAFAPLYCARYLDLEAQAPAVMLETYSRTVLNTSTPALTRYAYGDAGSRTAVTAFAVLGELAAHAARTFTAMSYTATPTLASATPVALESARPGAAALATHVARRLDPTVGAIARAFGRVNDMRAGLASNAIASTAGADAARRLVARLEPFAAAVHVQPLVASVRAYWHSDDALWPTVGRLAEVRTHGRVDGPAHAPGDMVTAAFARVHTRLQSTPRVYGFDTLAEDACAITDSPFACCPGQTLCLNCSVLDRVVFAAIDSTAIIARFANESVPVYRACTEAAAASDYFAEPLEPCAAAVCASRVCLADAECPPGVACIGRVSRCNSSALTDTCTCADTFRTRHRAVPPLLARLADVGRVPALLNVSYLVEVARGDDTTTTNSSSAVTTTSYAGETRARLPSEFEMVLVGVETLPGGVALTSATTSALDAAAATIFGALEDAVAVAARLGSRLLVCDVHTGLVCELADGANATCSTLDDERAGGGVGLVGGAAWATIVIVISLAIARRVPLCGMALSFTVWQFATGVVVPVIFMYAYGGAFGCYTTLPAIFSRVAVYVLVFLVRALVGALLLLLATLPCIEATPVNELRRDVDALLVRGTSFLLNLTYIAAVPLCFWRDVESIVREFFACAPLPPGAVSLERTPLATLTAPCTAVDVPLPALITADDVRVGASSVARTHDVFFYWLERACPGVNEALLAQSGGMTGYASYYAAHTAAAHATADAVAIEGYASLNAANVLVSLVIFVGQLALAVFTTVIVASLARATIVSVAAVVPPLLLLPKRKK